MILTLPEPSPEEQEEAEESFIEKKNFCRRSMDFRLAVVLLAAFFGAVAVFLFANFKKGELSQVITGGLAAISVAVENNGIPNNRPQWEVFSSQEAFKRYLDKSQRECGSFYGFQFQESANSKEISPSAKAMPANSAADNLVMVSEAGRYFALGEKEKADIAQLSRGRLYFSPENQFYWPASAISDRPAGETKIFNVSDPENIESAGAISQDGKILLLSGALAVFRSNTAAIFRLSESEAPKEIWRARVNKDSRIEEFDFIAGNLYLAVRTDIDLANPCPIKPIAINDKAVTVNCSSIVRPEGLVCADSVFTVLEIDIVSGQARREVSFVGSTQAARPILTENGIFAFWRENDRNIEFFTDFLNSKCKGLLPAYILEKAAALPGYGISSAAKEFELKSLLSGWMASLSDLERERVSSELAARIKSYLLDNYQSFEKTGIGKINLDDFQFTAQTSIPGALPRADFVRQYRGNLQILTFSGQGAARKMDWFVSGAANIDENEKTQTHAYLLDGNLLPVGVAANLNLEAGVCASRFNENRAYVSVCRAGAPIPVISFEPEAIGLRGYVAALPDNSFLYPISSELLLTAAKSNRQMKISLFDTSLAGKTDKIADLNLPAYWVDFEANNAAFAHDADNKVIFLPAARGGYVVGYDFEGLVLKKNVGGSAVSRAFFAAGNLYLAQDGGIEVFRAGDFEKAGGIKF